MAIDWGNVLATGGLSLFFFFIARGGTEGNLPETWHSPEEIKSDRRWSKFWYVVAVYFLLVCIGFLFNLS